ncbi:uncharacterized protein MELLADRAFT_110735 [Melampsora larici-populina 98AG31]|uniref:Uncharacterized protein n=1 Tax=Melampsora larici-populina (strain 98AG31 / pathotype 3-4-7) TaxID=747676 RepID=F4S0S5_MELLP|nr:uncharacterized protein MELLADRAFT_110735 [Melampsora larici-populina 98AG31]EGG01634.1 hypothetical protein MELLADRAFT_110735 [Melampsora larici-populina 98AG31]
MTLCRIFSRAQSPTLAVKVAPRHWWMCTAHWSHPAYMYPMISRVWTHIISNFQIGATCLMADDPYPYTAQYIIKFQTNFSVKMIQTTLRALWKNSLVTNHSYQLCTTIYDGDMPDSNEIFIYFSEARPEISLLNMSGIFASAFTATLALELIKYKTEHEL